MTELEERQLTINVLLSDKRFLQRENSRLKNKVKIFETTCIGLHFPGTLELYKFCDLVDENARMQKILFKHSLLEELTNDQKEQSPSLC